VLWGRRAALRRAARTVMGSTGRLHVRLVWLFSLISAVPTLLVVIFASFLFQSGNEFWFSDSSKGLLENANKLARGYYEQTQRDVEYESLAMAGDMREIMTVLPITNPKFGEQFSSQVLVRKLTNAAIVQKGADGKLHTAAITDPQVARDVTNAYVERFRAARAAIYRNPITARFFGDQQASVRREIEHLESGMHSLKDSTGLADLKNQPAACIFFYPSIK